MAAENAFKRAIELDPAKTHLYNRLAISLRQQGKLDEALKYFLQALDFTKNDEHLFYNISRVYLDQGNRRSARAYLDMALERKPDFEEALALLDQMQADSQQRLKGKKDVRS